MIGLERAMAHGYLRTRVKGYWDKRERGFARKHGPPPSSTGKPNLSGWKRLAAMFEKNAPGRLTRGGATVAI